MPLEIGGTAGKGSLSEKTCRDMLNLSAGEGGPFADAVLRVFTDGPEPNAAMVLADYTAPTNVTPALITGIALGTATNEGDFAQVQSLSSDNSFVYDGSGDPATIVGWMLTDGDTSTANILYCELLDEAVTLNDTHKPLVIAPTIKLTPVQSA